MDAAIGQKVAALELGMDQAELSRIERCHPRARELRSGELIRAATLYNRSADWLLGLSDVPTLRQDLAWRLAQLPPELARIVIEQSIYALHEFLEDKGLLK